MILFYSLYCPHCSMLLDSVKRYDTKQLVKLCCVEQLRKTNPRVLNQITAVPALLLIGQNGGRELLFGKDVFDYLLLPSRGRLMQPTVEPKSETPNGTQPSGSGSVGAAAGEPMGFELSSGAGSSGQFAYTYIENENAVYQGRAYGWSSISDGDGAQMVGNSVAISPIPAMSGGGGGGGGGGAVAAITSGMQGIGLETRTKEELPSMDAILANRDSDVAFLRPKQPPTDLRL